MTVQRLKVLGSKIKGAGFTDFFLVHRWNADTSSEDAITKTIHGWHWLNYYMRDDVGINPF